MADTDQKKTASGSTKKTTEKSSMESSLLPFFSASPDSEDEQPEESTTSKTAAESAAARRRGRPRKSAGAQAAGSRSARAKASASRRRKPAAKTSTQPSETHPETLQDLANSSVSSTPLQIDAEELPENSIFPANLSSELPDSVSSATPESEQILPATEPFATAESEPKELTTEANETLLPGQEKEPVANTLADNSESSGNASEKFSPEAKKDDQFFHYTTEKTSSDNEPEDDFSYSDSFQHGSSGGLGSGKAERRPWHAQEAEMDSSDYSHTSRRCRDDHAFPKEERSDANPSAPTSTSQPYTETEIPAPQPSTEIEATAPQSPTEDEAPVPQLSSEQEDELSTVHSSESPVLENGSRCRRISRDSRSHGRATPPAPITTTPFDAALPQVENESTHESGGGSFRGLVENLQGVQARNKNDKGFSVRTSQSPVVTSSPLHSAPSPSPENKVARVLICWVGKVDIGAALRHDTVNPGPIRMLMERTDPFDKVILLTTQNQGILDTLRVWLAPCISAQKLEVRRTLVRDLTDHGLICNAVMGAVDHAIQTYNLKNDGTGIIFHLSPGAPATHAVLLLLASTRYKGIRLMQTKLPGIGQQPEVINVQLPKQAFMVPSEAPTLPSAAAMVGELVPEGAGEPAGGGENQSADNAARNSWGSHYFRYGRKRSPGHGYQAGRTSTDQPAGAPASGKALRTGLTEQAQTQTPSVPADGDPPNISAALGTIYKKMQRVAPMYLPILLLGENGSGKSRLARFIHEWSGRYGKFISVDCAGLTEDMFTSELFGQKPGDTPSVWHSREGAFQQANAGTVFLENVNALTATQQTLLLRVLAPVGDTNIQIPSFGSRPSITVHVRIIASADNCIINDIRSGRFRSDLYYRLAGVTTTLPAVREYTPEERENLLRSFLVRLQHRLGQCWSFSGDAWQALLDETWPGNLREVSRMLQQICLLSDAGETISREEVLQQLRQGRITMFPQKKTQVQTFSQMTELPSPTEMLPQRVVATPASNHADYGLTVGTEGDDDEDEDGPGGFPESAPVKEKISVEKNGDKDFFVLGSGASIDARLHDMRMAKIAEALDQTGGNRAEAARLLGITYVQLSYTLRQQKKDDKHKGDGTDPFLTSPDD